MYKIIMCIGLVFLPAIAWSVSYTSPSTISNMSVGADFARVNTPAMTAAEGCSKSEWYILDFNNGATKEMYSMLLAAKASKQKVHFQLIGCHLDYPKVIHVYNCNSNSCIN